MLFFTHTFLEITNIEDPDMHRKSQPRFCSISDACEAIEFEDGKELEVLFEDSCSAYLINMVFFSFFLFFSWTPVEHLTLNLQCG